MSALAWGSSVEYRQKKTNNRLDIRSNGGHPLCSEVSQHCRNQTGWPLFLWYQFNFAVRRDHTMITMSQTKSANYLFIVVVLKSMRNSGVITAVPHRFQDRKSTRLNSSHVSTSYAVFC